MDPSPPYSLVVPSSGRRPSSTDADFLPYVPRQSCMAGLESKPETPKTPLRPSALPLKKISENLWAQARDKLAEKDKASLEIPKTGTNSIVDEVLSDVNANKERVTKNLIKIKTRRGEVPLRYYYDKLATWANKFKEVGDVLVQYDPAHAALPWAGVRFLISIAVNDSAIFSEMAEGVELVSGMVTRYAIIESLYLLEASKVKAQLTEAIVNLYFAILQYLLLAKSFYKKRTIQRSIESAIKTAHSVVEAPLAQILKEHGRFEEISKVVDAELRLGSDQKLNALQDTAESMFDEILRLRKSSAEMLQKLEPIEQLTTEISDLHAKLVDEKKSKERIEALQWLSRVPYESHHTTSREGLVQNSGLWLLERRGYIDWKDSSSSSALWLHGMVGCGKTKLMSVVIQRLLDEHGADPEAASVAYFYCNGSEQQRTKPEEILRTIARQLVWSGRDAPLRSPFPQIYAQRKQKSDDQGQPEPPKLNCEDCAALIISLLEDRPTIILVDALDECQDRASLLKQLTRILQSKMKVKVFLSGRDEVSREIPDSEFPSQIHISATDNHNDINRYIHTEVDSVISDRRLLNGAVNDDLKQHIINVLSKGALGMFLWVKLQLQNLCDKRMKIETDVRKELGHLPPGIKQLYENIFLQLEGSAEGSRSSAEAVLKWLLCARRPVSMKALIEAVSPVEDGKLILLTKEEVSLICCNLVVADEETDTFRLAHLSVQEFLEKKPAYQGSQLHAFATQRCIEEFVGPRSTLRSTEAPSADSAQSFHAYAVAHWEYHFACVEINDRTEELSQQIKDFLLDEDSFAAFNSEALESAERREYHSFPYESLGYLSQKPTPIFTVCRFGLPDVLEELDDEEVDWNQTNVRNDAPLHLAAVYGNEDVVKFLLDRDEVQPDKKGEWGYTPLMVACSEGMKPISTWLIEKDDVDVNTKDDIGQSALHHAAYEGRDACIDLLLEHNARKDAKDEEGRTPLYEAARTGQKTAVRRLLKAKADATATDTNGKTLLIAAIEGGKNQFEDVVQMLLKTDVDIQAQDKVGASALHFAAMQGQDRIVELLVKKKAPVSVKDHKGKTPLDYASRANNKKIIKFLLSHGATCEPDLEGRTELHEAIEGGCDVEIVKLFLSKNVDVNARTINGETALEFAASRRDDKDVVEVVQLLLEAGAEMDVVNSSGESTLHHAARGGSLPVMKFFLSRNIAVEARNQDGHTPLAIACLSAPEEVVRLLLDHGADAKVIDNDGNTILHLAVSGKSEEMVDMVLDQNGIDVTARNETGKTALDLAVNLGEYSIVRSLLAKGATAQSTTTNSTTPLHLAASATYKPKQYALVEALLEAGFDVNAKDETGCTPLQNAIITGAKKEAIILLLLDKGADMESKDQDGDTALHFLAKSSHKSESILQILLEKKADVNALNVAGFTPIFYMLRGYHPKGLQLFLDYGVNIHSTHSNGRSLLHVAASEGSSMLDILLEHGLDVDAKTEKGQTPLFLACDNSNLAAVKALVAHGAQTLIADNDGTTPLHMTSNEDIGLCLLSSKHTTKVDLKWSDFTPLMLAAWRGQLRLVQGLLARNDCNPSLTTKEGRDALSYAAEYDRADVVDELLQADGVDATAHDEDKMSALHYASEEGYHTVVQKLLEKDASNLNSQTVAGDTPLNLATRNDHRETVKLLLAQPNIDLNVRYYWFEGTALINAVAKQYQTVSLMLLEHQGIDAAIRTRSGRTPLAWACLKGMEEIYRQLLTKPNVEVVRPDDTPLRQTPLHLAAQGGHATIVKLLLENKGVEADVRGGFNRSPLWYAARKGAIDVVSVLLEHNVEIDALDKDGKTPLCQAAEQGHAEVVRYLLEHGAKSQLDLALELALQERHGDVVTQLREAGAEEMTDRFGLERLFGSD